MSITRGKKILLETVARKMKKIISAFVLCIALIVLCVQIGIMKYKGTVHQHGQPVAASRSEGWNWNWNLRASR